MARLGKSTVLLSAVIYSLLFAASSEALHLPRALQVDVLPTPVVGVSNVVEAAAVAAITPGPRLEVVNDLRLLARAYQIPLCAQACVAAAITKSTNCQLGEYSCECEDANARVIASGSAPCVESACGIAVAFDVDEQSNLFCVSVLEGLVSNTNAGSQSHIVSTVRAPGSGSGSGSGSNSGSSPSGSGSGSSGGSSGSSSNNNNSNNNGGSSLSTAAIVGIAVGSTAGVFIILIIIWRIWAHQRKNKYSGVPVTDSQGADPRPPPPQTAEVKPDTNSLNPSSYAATTPIAPSPLSQQNTGGTPYQHTTTELPNASSWQQQHQQQPQQPPPINYAQTPQYPPPAGGYAVPIQQPQHPPQQVYHEAGGAHYTQELPGQVANSGVYEMSH